VGGVEVGPAVVAIAVTEFGFALRYAADAQIQLAPKRRAPPSTPNIPSNAGMSPSVRP
jgi:hypothetical protein